MAACAGVGRAVVMPSYVAFFGDSVDFFICFPSWKAFDEGMSAPDGSLTRQCICG